MARPRSRRRAAALVLAAGALFAAAPAGAAGQPPSPGAPGVGDPLFPGLGNGGYDVQHYVLDLRYATADPRQSIDGSVTIIARATQALSRFNLDWAGEGIGGVTVNGEPAQWVHEGEELVVTPEHPLRNGRKFAVRVSGFVATPTDPSESTAFFYGESGSAMAGQPDVAHRVYPSNDHPSDKATFAFRIDVPAGTTAVANGLQTGRRTRGGRTLWKYLERNPMATELTQLAVGDFAIIWRPNVGDVRIRDVVPRHLVDELAPKLARARLHLNFIRGLVGPYPFDVYGSFVLDADFRFALETQTLSILPASLFDFSQGFWDNFMAHEIAHQWFGNAVAPEEWSDLWLNEGWSTWFDVLFNEREGNLEDFYGVETLEELMERTYASGDEWRALYGPVAEPRVETFFSPNVYEGGALVLFALRERIGPAAFRKLQREWFRRFNGRSAGTDEFIALASEVAGEDLSGFLQDWLYGTVTPLIPSRPDWTQGAVDAGAVPAAAGTAVPLRRR